MAQEQVKSGLPGPAGGRGHILSACSGCKSISGKLILDELGNA